MKLNFLSDLNKKIVFKEYLIRLCIFFFFFFFFSMLCALVFLIPSYFLTGTKERAISSDHFRIMNKTQEKGESIESRLIIKNTINKMNLLSSEVLPVGVYELLEKVLSNKGSVIKINSFFYGGEKGGLKELKISGIAETREGLLSFSKLLKKEKFFEKIEVPIPNLAKYKNLEFTISILGNF